MKQSMFVFLVGLSLSGCGQEYVLRGAVVPHGPDPTVADAPPPLEAPRTGAATKRSAPPAIVTVTSVEEPGAPTSADARPGPPVSPDRHDAGPAVRNEGAESLGPAGTERRPIVALPILTTAGSASAPPPVFASGRVTAASPVGSTVDTSISAGPSRASPVAALAAPPEPTEASRPTVATLPAASPAARSTDSAAAGLYPARTNTIARAAADTTGSAIGAAAQTGHQGHAARSSDETSRASPPSSAPSSSTAEPDPAAHRNGPPPDVGPVDASTSGEVAKQALTTILDAASTAGSMAARPPTRGDAPAESNPPPRTVALATVRPIDPPPPASRLSQGGASADADGKTAPVKQPPREPMTYRLKGGDRTGVTTAFDDGHNTYFVFGSSVPPELVLFGPDGEPIPYDRYGSTVVAKGVHPGVTIRTYAGQSSAVPDGPLQVTGQYR